jgi:hypothetical protein
MVLSGIEQIRSEQEWVEGDHGLLLPRIVFVSLILLIVEVEPLAAHLMVAANPFVVATVFEQECLVAREVAQVLELLLELADRLALMELE